MISLRITRLPSDNDEALWNAGFNLDDLGICIECIESDTRVVDEIMENYCVGYNEVEYNGKWYYTVHHA